MYPIQDLTLARCSYLYLMVLIHIAAVTPPEDPSIDIGFVVDVVSCWLNYS